MYFDLPGPEMGAPGAASKHPLHTFAEGGRARSVRGLDTLGALGGLAGAGAAVVLAGQASPPAAARKRAWTLPASPGDAVAVVGDPDGGVGGVLAARGERSAFVRGFRPALTIAQVLALLPVSRPADAHRASFRWRSPRAVLSVVVIAGALTQCLMALLRTLETGLKLNTTVHAIFFGTTATAQMVFLRISGRWKPLMEDVARADLFCLREYGPPPRLRARMLAVTAASVSMALVEHALSNAGTLFYVWPCYQRGGIFLVWQGYFLTKYLKTFELIPFATWKGLLLLTLQFINVAVWNFMDLFVALFAMGLSARFRQVNTELRSVQSEVRSVEYWRRKRKQYNALADLVRRADDALGPLILVCYVVDLYFLCLQLLSLVNAAGVSWFHRSFFVFSMSYLIMRMTFMTYVAANIHEESKRPREVLFSLPEAAYSVEADRFLMQVLTDNVALTGCNFFSISRSFLLKVAGTIVTYLVVLVQFNNKESNPDAAQSNGTVSCTCADIKVEGC